jgi:NitT/TauT family transport system ATP-binding protein
MIEPMSKHAARIVLENVVKSFASSVSSTGLEDALGGVSLTIEPGEFVSILGPSGCGKSTLLRMLADLDQPTSGKVSCGDTVRSFVFQDSALLPWKTVYQNVELPLRLADGRFADTEDRVNRALKLVDLLDARHKFPNQLSGGMKMRASVARALITEPKLLLLDEPFAALDETTRHRLQEELRALWLRIQQQDNRQNEAPMTVVFVTHSIAEAVFLSNRAVVMSARPGRIVLDQSIALPRERRASDRMSASFAEAMRPIDQAFHSDRSVL